MKKTLLTLALMGIALLLSVPTSACPLYCWQVSPSVTCCQRGPACAVTCTGEEQALPASSGELFLDTSQQGTKQQTSIPHPGLSGQTRLEGKLAAAPAAPSH